MTTTLPAPSLAAEIVIPVQAVSEDVPPWMTFVWARGLDEELEAYVVSTIEDALDEGLYEEITEDVVVLYIETCAKCLVEDYVKYPLDDE